MVAAKIKTRPPKHDHGTEYGVYLAGPMSKVPKFNFPEFFEATTFLRDVQGWGVLSPAEKDLDTIPLEVMQLTDGYDTGNLAVYSAASGFTMSNAMEWDLPAIMNSKGIVLLDGWETSTGARWERTVAEALGRDVWLLHRAASTATGWQLERDEDQQQLTKFLKTFGEPNTGVVGGSELRVDPPDVYNALDFLARSLGHSASIAQDIEHIRAKLP